MGFYTSVTLPAWKGECPIYNPICERGSHFGEPAPPEFLSLASSTQIGLSSVLNDLTGMSSTLTQRKVDSGVLPLWSICKLLYISEMAYIANG